ncbi:hypothetical protein [Tautonia sociabilis]|uniref:Uncharacterized protein n=1 Tax=Tautonia sociabilis TaxID=2080755 RepID=A0A432MNP0_9BACT|nr:hypothetical protein [Tautonia sociabilis]RUL88869.1 hypothetical protein TsocGM_04465 [Tautonia sociabilis]
MPIVARPRMFSLLIALLASVPAVSADEPGPSPEPKPTPKVDGVANTVKLDLQISGVGAGWKVRIKPAHAGSRFEPVVREVEHGDDGPVRLEEISIDATSLTADRDCALAIVLTGPDGVEQTFKRSVRLLPQPDADTVPELSKTFYLRTSTVASKETPRPRPD